jgi:Periplasmic protease
MALADPVIGMSVGGTLRSTWHEGLLGADFLSRFRLGIDYAHHRLLLSRTGGAAEPFDRSGSFLAGGDLKRIVVRQVLQGGPAQAAGLMPGDEIVSVNGMRAEALGLPAVRERLKAPRVASVLVVYERGGERRRANIQLRDLL